MIMKRRSTIKKKEIRMNKQPEFIFIHQGLRLKTPQKKEWDLAYPWY